MNNKAYVIKQLKTLKKNIGKQGQSGLEARIAFFCVAIVSGLKEALNSYELFDKHNLGERDLCTCFEMHDGDEVVHGIISQAKKNPLLDRMIKREYGEEFFKGHVDIQ
ncbi:hypothetical protein L3081_24980 [Colwellia sp. MSW7]|uniref:Uncharacterized protein n=1 Tax=Colwellia maritima TaxID=2912588 RepID=A0ABS9X7K0_9GAMM|nr:hypothetical protein [Colwellia maritima]MCI2286080.1 hypothetical protein [Colwellia maritima]